MRFLVDAQLPPALARWFAKSGHGAWHVHDIGLEGASDNAIWQEAIRRDAVIVTKDEDFVLISSVTKGPQVVWLRSGNTPRRVLLDRMERIFPEVLEALQSGERIVEIR